MHHLSSCILSIMIFVVISARSSPPSNSLLNDYRSCPEEYRELRRRHDETNFESNGDSDDNDDDIYGSESREEICEQAMDMVVHHRDFNKFDPTLFFTYCPHYDERLALAKEDNNTLCEHKKQELLIEQKRQALKKKRDGIFSDDDDDDYKRRALRRRELKKRVALRFIRKRMS